MTEFRYLRRADSLKAGQVEIEDDGSGNGTWVAPKHFVWDASLSSLRRAILNYADNWDLDGQGLDSWKGVDVALGELYVSPAEPDEFSVDYSERFSTSVCVLAGGVLAVTVEMPLHGADLQEEDFAPFLTPVLARHGSDLRDVTLHGEGNQVFAVIRLGFERRGATVADAVEFGQAVESLLNAVRGGGLTAESAFALVAAGRADLLIGQAESSWLEVKSQGYDLSIDAGRIELGQDVARFANGDESGLLVIGFRTRRSGHQEVISKMTPSLSRLSSSRYHKAIDDKVFPPLIGLELHEVEVMAAGRAGHLLAILVPAQPEESKPVLVHDAIVGDKTEGAFISIVQRRGEHSITITAQSIHATLAAGRALLRRGEVPD